MPFEKRFRRFGRKSHHEAVIGLRQVHRQIMSLALHRPADHHLSLSPKSAQHLPADEQAVTNISALAQLPGEPHVVLRRPPYSRRCSRARRATARRSRLAVCRCFSLFRLVAFQDLIDGSGPGIQLRVGVLVAAADSPAAPSSAASSAPSHELARTAWPPRARCSSCRRRPLAAPAHTAPLCTPSQVFHKT